MIRETGVKQKLAIGKSEEDEKNFLIICMMKNGTAVCFSRSCKRDCTLVKEIVQNAKTNRCF